MVITTMPKVLVPLAQGCEELEAVTDDLLLAMHDLRSVLVRKKADRLSKAQTGKP